MIKNQRFINLFVSTCLFLSLTELSYANRIASSKINPNDAIPFSLSISGGVSLGSYEAGINWAILNYLKLQRKSYEHDNKGRYFLFPELSSLSGASAGSINALFSVISWCVDDHKAQQYVKTNNVVYEFKDTIENNLFRDIWVNVGIEKLLPDSSVKGNYYNDDGLFTRQAFDEAINNVKSALKQAIFREDCTVPFGITVTRVKPGTISVAGVKVNNQRFMIPFRIESTKGSHNRAVIVSHIVNKNDSDMGNVMYLQGVKDSSSPDKFVIDINDLVESILTSSAFPIAFGRKKLNYCSRIQDKKTQKKSTLCPDGYQESTDEFLDGGVFDNVPLGIAKALAEPKPTDYDLKTKWKKSARRYNYIYIDPDNLRSTSGENAFKSQSDEHDQKMTFGLSKQLEFLEGAINTGRNYELYNILRGGEWTRQTYTFACDLYSAIHDTSAEQCISSSIALKQCKKLYQRIDSSKDISKLTLSNKDWSSCLLQSAMYLEREYTLKVKKSKFLDFICKNNAQFEYNGERILAARRCLLSRISTMAKNLKRPELVYAIDEALKDDLGDRRILITSRFAPITGNLLSYFGAFLDRAFREYDYYAGVYDAINVIANYSCKRISSKRCLSDRIKNLYNSFGINQSAAANTVFMLLAKHEHLHISTSGLWRWLDKPQITTYKTNQEKILVGNLKIIFDSLLLTVEKNKITELGLFDEFIFFSKTLLRNNYDTSNSSTFIKRVERLKNEDASNWFFPITTNISNRLIQLETNEIETSKKPNFMRQLLGIGSLAVHSYIKNGDDSLFRQSSAPNNSWHQFLPYEFGVDARNGGLLIAWEPSISLSKDFGLNLNLVPILMDRFADSEIVFSQASLYLSYSRNSMMSSVGLGPTITSTWKQWPNSNQTNFGASIYAGFVKDKLRLTAGVRSIKKDRFYGDSFYVNFSVTDVPGFFYWLLY